MALRFAAAALILASTAALAQPPSPLDGFVISETHPFDDPKLGTSYRYTKSGEPVFDVYLYPYASPELASSADGETPAALAGRAVASCSPAVGW